VAEIGKNNRTVSFRMGFPIGKTGLAGKMFKKEKQVDPTQRADQLLSHPSAFSTPGLVHAETLLHSPSR
jgi:hypothetical protein